MTTKTIHQTVLGGTIGALLDALDDAEPHIGRHEVTFPRIAVLGDESAGKSSLLESICEIPFPRGSTLTTKCPTQIRLRRRKGASWSGSAWTTADDGDGRNFEIVVQDKEQITEVVRNLQKLELERVNTMSHHETMFAAGPIIISVEDDDIADLTLVDLPGYFQRTGNIISGDEAEVNWSAKEVKRVTEILLDYIRDDKTLLLVVLPISTQFKTAGIMKIIEDYKERLQDQEKIQRLNARIIYCVTKCDKYRNLDNELEAPPQQVEDLLRNEGSFSSKPHGWYFVMNHAESQAQSQDFISRLAACRDFEKNFFDNTGPYNHPDYRDRCGTQNLLHKLTDLLESEIRGSLKTIRSNTEKALAYAREELKYLGPAPIKQEYQKREFHRIVQRIKMYYVQICDGVYGELRARAQSASTGVSMINVDKCKFGHTKTLRFDLFKEEIERTCKLFDDDAYLSGLEQRVKEAKSGIMEPTMPIPQVLYDEIRECIEPWKKHAETVCEDIASYAVTCLEVIVDIEAGKYKKLPEVLKVYLKQLIHEQKTKALIRLRWNHVDEIARPNSLKESWVQEVLSAEAGQNRSSEDGQRRNSQDGLRSNADIRMMRPGSDVNGTAAAYVTRLKAYFPVAQIRYVDNVVRTISTHIMDVPRGVGVGTSVEGEEEPKFFFEGSEILEGKSVEDLMKLSDDVERRRNTVTTRYNVLRRLRQAIRDHADRLPNGFQNGSQ